MTTTTTKFTVCLDSTGTATAVVDRLARHADPATEIIADQLGNTWHLASPCPGPPWPPVIALPCPDGITPAELLNDLIDMAGDAIDYRAPDDADYCGACEKTELPGGGTEVIFCGDHAEDDENARIYAKVKAHLKRVQAGHL